MSTACSCSRCQMLPFTVTIALFLLLNRIIYRYHCLTVCDAWTATIDRSIDDRDPPERLDYVLYKAVPPPVCAPQAVEPTWELSDCWVHRAVRLFRTVVEGLGRCHDISGGTSAEAHRTRGIRGTPYVAPKVS